MQPTTLNKDHSSTINDLLIAHHTAPAKMMVDEDIKMELAEIATAVKGNDKGSEELDDNELEGGETVGRAEMEREADAEEDTNSDDMASEGEAKDESLYDGN